VCPDLRACIGEHIQAQGHGPGNPAGLERSALALKFALASLEDAIDALDQSSTGNDWYSPCIAAHDTLELVQTAIACATGPHLRPESFDAFFGRN
jgi:hypothetical protein